MPRFPMVSPHLHLCWMWCVRLPEVLSPLVARSLPLSPHMCACVWMVSRIVSHCPLHMCACVGFPRPCLAVPPIVSHGLPTCVPVLDGVSAFPRSPLSPLVSHSVPLSPHMRACVGSCVRLPEVLSPLSPIFSHCLPTCVCACVGWYGVSAFLKSFLPLSSLASPCLPLSPIVAHMCLCWKVRSPSRGLVSPLSPRMPVLDGVSAFASSCLPLSLNASHCSHCLPLSPHMCACVGWCVRFWEVCLCWMVCPHSRALVSSCLPACLPLSPHMCACVG